jgi:NADP-dependent 3-hydroxy acid dehydrogenase YdfG
VQAACAIVVRASAISSTPGYVDTELPSSMTDSALREQGQASMKALAIPASAIAEAMAFAIGQPDSVDVGEIVVRPTAQA